MAAYGDDRRGSSIAREVDAAIERVVQHFESNDLALRLDVLRALSAQSRLAFETARVRERLGQHPVSMDLIAGVTSQSPVYKALAERLTVESCSCDYDAQRNVVMATTVRWTLAPSETEHKAKKTHKKRKKTASTATRGPMITHYKFERVRVPKQIEEKQEAEEEGQEEEEEEGESAEETMLRFTVVVAMGDDDVQPKELLHFEMACESAYPRSYYEEQQQLESDSESDDDKQESKSKSEAGEQEAEKETEGEEEGEEEVYYGEQLRDFRFDEAVLAGMAQWMGAPEEDLDPVDVVGFFMALPVHEDEWLVDERVCEVLFSGMANSDDEEGEGEGEGEGEDEDEQPESEQEAQEDGSTGSSDEEGDEEEA